jgi:hypothetical protein
LERDPISSRERPSSDEHYLVNRMYLWSEPDVEACPITSRWL